MTIVSVSMSYYTCLKQILGTLETMRAPVYKAEIMMLMYRFRNSRCGKILITP